MLCAIRRPITFVHVFRLAEAFGATVVLMRTELDQDAVALLNQLSPRWTAVRVLKCSTIDDLRETLHRNCWHPVALEITSGARPYFEVHPPPSMNLAFIVGSEDSGVADDILDLAADQVFIPMVGRSSCLAAGMALAIVASHFAFVEATAPPRDAQSSQPLEQSA